VPPCARRLGGILGQHRLTAAATPILGAPTAIPTVELEKRRCFDQVEDKVTKMEDFVKNCDRLPYDSDAPVHHHLCHHHYRPGGSAGSPATATGTGVMGSGSGGSGPVRTTPGNDEEPSNFFDLYLDVGHIRDDPWA
jgi:hypothetical protein